MKPGKDDPVHLLVIENHPVTDGELHMYIECPFESITLEHREWAYYGTHLEQHYCTWTNDTPVLYLEHQFRFQGRRGATIYISGLAPWGPCGYTEAAVNEGLAEMLGFPFGWQLDDPLPEDFPTEPGQYPIWWDSDGSGEDFNSWFQLERPVYRPPARAAGFDHAWQ